jgi:hypothetical protein
LISQMFQMAPPLVLPTVRIFSFKVQFTSEEVA